MTGAGWTREQARGSDIVEPWFESEDESKKDLIERVNAALTDSYQQGRVAGARDYRDTIIKELDLDNSKQQEFTRTDVILALAHADDTLAQQAQEGVVGDAEN